METFGDSKEVMITLEHNVKDMLWKNLVL
jgi:hypothetical protein